MHDLDELVASDARRWREKIEAAVVRDPDWDDLHSPRSRRRAALWPVAAAACVAIVAIAYALIASTDRPNRTAGSRLIIPRGLSVGSTETPPPVISKASQRGLIRFRPAQRISAPRASTLHSTPWSAVELDSSGRVLTIRYFAGGDCRTDPVGVYVSESNSQVLIATLASFSFRSYPLGTDCASTERVAIAQVTLNRPLGDRTLRHAAIDPALGSIRLP